jgi:hypothetical protein
MHTADVSAVTAATTNVGAMTTTVMFASMMGAAVSATVFAAAMPSTVTTAAFRNGKATGRQDGRENNDCNSEIEFGHGTLTARHTATRCSRNAFFDALVPLRRCRGNVSHCFAWRSC